MIDDNPNETTLRRDHLPTLTGRKVAGWIAAGFSFLATLWFVQALACFETPLGRLIRAGARVLWAQVMPSDQEETETTPSLRVRRRRPIPIRRANGQLAGSFRAGNDPEHGSRDRSAQESGGTTVTTVPIGTLTIPDMLIIAARLGQETAPNEVAKSLPGYSGRKYGEYVERVRHVKPILEEHGALRSAAED